MNVISGTVGYIARTGKEDGLRGVEEFQLCVDSRGGLSGISLAHIYDSGILREASCNFAPDRTLIDAWVRLRERDVLRGHAYYRTDRHGELTVDGWQDQLGHVRQVVPFCAPYTFITHSVAFDAWHFLRHSGRVGQVEEIAVYNTATQWNGLGGPIGHLESMNIVLDRIHEVEVAAGVFQAKSWRQLSSNPEIDEVFITTDATGHLLLSLNWPAMGTTYELLDVSERSDNNFRRREGKSS